jgi:hypothetical protein
MLRLNESKAHAIACFESLRLAPFIGTHFSVKSIDRVLGAPNGLVRLISAEARPQPDTVLVRPRAPGPTRQSSGGTPEADVAAKPPRREQTLTAIHRFGPAEHLVDAGSRPTRRSKRRTKTGWRSAALCGRLLCPEALASLAWIYLPPTPFLDVTKTGREPG